MKVDPKRPVLSPDSKTAHPTPGPWSLEYDGSVVIGGQIAISPGSIGPDDVSGEERKANCRLIAAAPELLTQASVLHCLGTSKRFQTMTVADALAELRRNECGYDDGVAIAKATGGADPLKSRRILQPPPLEINRVLYPSGRIPPRRRLEQRLVWNLLADLADAGFLPDAVLSDDAVETNTAIKVMEEVFNLDEARVYFTGGNWVYLVFGNDGWDAVSDWGWKQNEPGKRFNAVLDAFDGEAFA